MIRVLLIAALVAVASPAFADDTYEVRAQGAKRVTQLGDLVWAFTATCDATNDVQARQCRQLRDARQKAYAAATMILDAEPGTFVVGAYDAAKKSATLTLTGCIRCAGVTVESKPWQLTVGVPKQDGPAARTAPLYDTSRTFPEAASRDQWAASTAHARVEVVVKLASKPVWSVAGKEGLAFDMVAYRVVEPCSGAIVVAAPVAQPLPGDKTACAAAPVRK